jgi:hypothetical protein
MFIKKLGGTEFGAFERALMTSPFFIGKPQTKPRRAYMAPWTEMHVAEHRLDCLHKQRKCDRDRIPECWLFDAFLVQDLPTEGGL